MKQLAGLIIIVLALMGFQTVQKKQAPAKPVTATVPANTMKAVMDRGKMIYTQQCLACHQENGGGVPNMNAPLNKAKAVVGNDKAKIIRIVLQGMKGVDIDDEPYNNTMAPHPELTDQQIADVLTFIRNNWNNKASSVRPAEVKMVRARTK